MQTPLYDAKKINTNVDIIQLQWQNHSCTGNIYNKLPKKNQTQGVRCVKFTNLPHRAYI